MTGLAEALADALLAVGRGTSFAGETWYVQLHVGDPGAAGTGNPSAVTTRHAPTFSAPDGGEMALSALSAWTMTDTETITHLTGWTASTSGTFRWSVELDDPIDVVNGSILAVDTLTIGLGPVAADPAGDTDPVGQSPGLWTLVFADDFAGSSVDDTKWYGWLPEQVETNNSNEVQQYDEAMTQVTVTGGSAVVTAVSGTFADLPNPMSNGQTPLFKSGMISTMPRGSDTTSPGFGIARGYVEARIRLSAPDGSTPSVSSTDGHAWPAWWGICVDGLWGDTGAPEFDWMEVFSGSNRQNYWKESGASLSGPDYGHTVSDSGLDGWHVHGCHWTDTDIFWFVDGVLQGHFSGSSGDVTTLPIGLMFNLALRSGATQTQYACALDYVRAWKPDGAPARPVITSVTPGNGQITVNFNAVSGAVSYRALACAVTPHADGLSTQRHSSQPHATGSGTTLVINTGLTNDASYRVCVDAVDSGGRYSECSHLSAVVVPTAVSGPPNTPTIGTATAGDTTASVGFTPAGSGPAATSYTATSTPGSHTGSGSSSPITVTGLTNGTAYTFTVHAHNTAGNSSESSASNSVTPSGGGGGGTTLLQDSFDRADGALGTADVGGAWSFMDPFTVSGNEAKTPSVGFFTAAVLNAGAGHTDGTLTCTIDASANPGVDCGLIARYTDDTHLIVLDMSRNSGDSFFAKLFVRNGSTSLTGISSLWTFTSVTHIWDVKLVLSGSTITVSVDTGSGWTVLGSGTDTTGQAGTKFGIARVDAAADAKFNDFHLTT